MTAPELDWKMTRPGRHEATGGTGKVYAIEKDGASWRVVRGFRATMDKGTSLRELKHLCESRDAYAVAEAARFAAYAEEFSREGPPCS